jgi:DNA polymerase III delta' subunit
VRLTSLIGQSRPASVLSNAIRRDRVAHAYVFHGPDGVGKSTAALLFAQALNCSAGRGKMTPDACGACPSCQLIQSRNHPDVLTITLGIDDDGRERSEISIHQIRQDPKRPRAAPLPLIQDAYLKPALGRYKVYIIDPADRMNPAASNALLKVLEEPPAHVVIVMVTSQRSALLPTVLSRCQQVAFQLAGMVAIEQHLLRLGLEAAAAGALARLSGGRAGWAVEAARRPGVLLVRKALLALCARLESQSIGACLRIAEEIKGRALEMAQVRARGQDEATTASEADKEGEEPESARDTRSTDDRTLRAELPWCLDVMVSYYRDLLAASEGSDLINADNEDMIRTGTESRSRDQTENAILAVLGARRHIQRNANIDLTLESLAIRLLGVD